MKKAILILIILPFAFARAQSNVYHPFPESAAVWNFDSYQWCGGFGFDTWEHVYSIVMSGDTVINSKTYHRLQVPIEVISSSGGCGLTGMTTHPGYYAGSIRQDTAIRKVFFVPPTKMAEQLLYDFTLNVGDTVKGCISTSDKVVSIDSVLVNNTYRKRWNINPTYHIYIIEGVGSTYGLKEQSIGSGTDGPVYFLTCFQQSGKSVYPDTATGCPLITSVTPLNKSLLDVKANPNPTSDHVQLLINSDILNSTRISYELYDITGKLVIREYIQNEQTQIDFPNINGLYLIKVSDGINSKQFRVIKN